MPLTFTLFTEDTKPTPALPDQLLALWTDVSNAGGAVGFVPPVTPADIRPRAEAHLSAMAEGRTRLLAAFTTDGRLAATAFLSFNDHPLMRHWAWLYTVMVDPALQGRGYGAELLREAERQARDLGLDALRLTCRGGEGLERFYASCGYKEVGRVPEAIRVAPGDDRDDVVMLLPLPRVE
ncbi:GNAT family N-acetyltransferase [Streptomyces fagopyri]|uniref:GNAT family N-acetyltransferase n=1 Tax=Streptomyces fagopyri TaxID=2662397 RepID=UPI00382F6843